MSDIKVYEPQIRALLGTASHLCEEVVLESRTILLRVRPMQSRGAPAAPAGGVGFGATDNTNSRAVAYYFALKKMQSIDTSTSQMVYYWYRVSYTHGLLLVSGQTAAVERGASCSSAATHRTY